VTDVRDPGAPAGADEAESDDAAGPGEGLPGGTTVVSTAAVSAAGSGANRAAPAPGVPTRTRWGGRRPGWRLGLVGVVLVAAVGFLLYKGIGTSLDYYVTVRQALDRHGSLVGKTFRLQGIVVPGTISHHGDTVAFTIAQPGDRHLQIPVVNQGNPPQLFKKGVPVIVQGHFTGSTFESTQLLVDHTGNYSPQRDGPRNGGSSAGSSSSGSNGSASSGRASSASATPGQASGQG
jgi:cytochrome c-type biogenesis protein CcmE